MELTELRVHVVVSSSYRLRYEVLQELMSQWDGPIERSSDPPQLADLLMQMDTPSLFGDNSLHIIAASDAYLSKHAALIAEQVGKAIHAGVLIIHAAALPKGKSPLRNALKKEGGLHTVTEPGTRAQDLEKWLQLRLDNLSVRCEHSLQVARSLIQHRGQNIDALLSSIDVLEQFADDQAISPETVHELIGGSAQEPLYKFSDAFLKGESRTALGLMYAGKGLESQGIINSLSAEIRKLLCALDWSEPDEISYHAGMKRKLSDKAVWAIRKRAMGMGKRCLLRLLTGIIQAQKDLRSTGRDEELIMETLVYNASRVIRSMR
ncbi:MAG: hypothetical protein HRU15_02215 [Planctomycetes bacterium]|nr:hypothetical protein [Planctomycetota bacterium]